MRALIWIGCIFANAIITTLFKQNGIILGAIPTVLLYLGAVYLARYLCGLWDERRTTVEAHNILSAHNYHGKKRKDTVDAVAASLILEGYLAFRGR